jgi:GAF domain-containing protein
MRRGSGPKKAPTKAKSTPRSAAGKGRPRAAPAPRHLEERLAEALEQQTAMSEILRVISSSPTDAQPVFETIVKNARALCGSDSAGVFMYDGEMVSIEALDNANPAQASALRDAYPSPATAGTATGRALLSGRPAHIPDVSEDSAYVLDALRDTVGLRTLLSVPMVRDGVSIGAITVQRWGTPRAFSDTQIALLGTFADQAVIAIQNVRLFRELDARNHDLTETLQQQTATSEIARHLGLADRRPARVRRRRQERGPPVRVVRLLDVPPRR